MIISSWNVNSVRARIENIKEYLKKYSPDILMMQEIKAQDENYPYEDIEKSNNIMWIIQYVCAKFPCITTKWLKNLLPQQCTRRHRRTKKKS